MGCCCFQLQKYSNKMSSPWGNGATPRICIIGAGFSGLCMAIQLKLKLNLETFTIYEACEEVGGTWFVNTYPGCGADIPGQLYSFSFAPKYDWSELYCSQKEILEYAKDVARKYNVYPFIRFRTRVQTLRWNAQTHKWHATILNLETKLEHQEEFDFIISGTGKTRIPHYPAQYLRFKGTLVHSGEWKPIDLRGKRVGVVGTGPSAVQVIIAIAPEVKHLTVFQRKAPTIIPRLQIEYPAIVKWALAKIPGLHKLSRFSQFWGHELVFGATKHGSWMNKLGTKISRRLRECQLVDPVLRDKSTPHYPLGCKRVIPSENYYNTLARPNVELVTDKIVNVEGQVVQTSKGERHHLDVLVLATGFQPQDFFAPLKVYGRDGVDVIQEWKRGRPRAYMGILSRAMPNFFTLLGPYTVVGHSSNLFNVECQVEWTLRAIKMTMEKGARGISITKEAEDEFMEYVDKPMKDTVWVKGNCQSWYFDAKGENTMLWPHSQVEFWRKCRTLNEGLFEFSF